MNNKKVLIPILVILLIAVVSISTFAIYKSSSTGNVTLETANWKIKLNGQDITSNNTFTYNLKEADWTHDAVIDSDEQNLVVIAPGSYGTFNLTIDATEAEVNVQYEITARVLQNNTEVNLSDVNSNLSIGYYNNETLINSNSISGNMDAMTSHSLELRVTWNEVDSTQSNTQDININDQNFVVEVTVVTKQYIIPAPVSFATDSWDTIINAVKTNNTSVYSVGDTKQIELDGFGTHTIRISNKSTPDECSTQGFSQTACGFVIEFTDTITNYYMNSQSTNLGGWPASAMREYISTTIFDSFPDILKQNIISTKVVSGHGSSDSSNFTTDDKLYLLSVSEVCSPENDYDTAAQFTRKLDVYSSNTSCFNISPQKNPGYWWLRSIDKGSSTFMHIKYGTTISWNGNGASSTTGVSPAFRLG